MRSDFSWTVSSPASAAARALGSAAASQTAVPFSGPAQGGGACHWGTRQAATAAVGSRAKAKASSPNITDSIVPAGLAEGASTTATSEPPVPLRS